jgi:hypothetical protein
MVHPPFKPLLKKTYWNWLSATARNVTVFSKHFTDRLEPHAGMLRTPAKSGLFGVGDCLLRHAMAMACHAPGSIVVKNRWQDDVGPAEHAGQSTKHDDVLCHFRAAARTPFPSHRLASP